MEWSCTTRCISGVRVRPRHGEHMKSQIQRLGWFCMLACELAGAQGGPPLLGDDPETPGPGKWEINIAYTEQRTNEEHLRSLPHVDFNYGLGDHSHRYQLYGRGVRG